MQLSNKERFDRANSRSIRLHCFVKVIHQWLQGAFILCALDEFPVQGFGCLFQWFLVQLDLGDVAFGQCFGPGIRTML